jgi:signal transduction histidine kinase/CHASE3 domain sensor protein
MEQFIHGMLRSKLQWWGRLRVQRKVELVLFAILTPLLFALSLHVYLIKNLLFYQDVRHDIVLVRERIGELRRLAIDIEDAFRGYLLTRSPEFLAPMHEAETHLAEEIIRASGLTKDRFVRHGDMEAIENQLKQYLSSKQGLIQKVERGQFQEVLEYVRTGQGVQLADALRTQFRHVEDQLDDEITRYNEQATQLSQTAFRGLLAAVVGTLALGWLGAFVMARSVTERLALLRNLSRTLGRDPDSHAAPMEAIGRISSRDEIGELAQSYEEMAQRIRRHLKELEVLQAIGHEINTIGPDGLTGVLRRITDRAAELVQADLCLVLLRNDQMSCWIIEAASGNWNEGLSKSVMLWEELPICAKAFETGEPAHGERLRDNSSPELARRNLIGNSMLAVPLLNQGKPFGVLVLLSEANVRREEWNVRLALGLAQGAAVAISNARLYEIVHEKHQTLLSRVRELEQLAETIAHDLKGPGQRMAELASLLQRECAGSLDERGKRWLTLVEQNGKELTDRADGILSVARVGARRAAATFVDARAVLSDVLKSHAEKLEEARAHVTVQDNLPLVACHSAYLRQVLDNLISNSLKFSRREVPLEITVRAQRRGKMVHLTVKDNGIGIPAAFRQRVFDAFVRLDPLQTKGSGIGLTITKRIVELYGGQVWIEASDQPGTTITFSLPILDDWENPSPALVPRTAHAHM